MHSVILQLEDSGRTVQLVRGEEVTISLAENPTTGYRWNSLVIDGTAIMSVESRYVPPSVQAPGAGGRRLFMLRAVNTGHAEVSSRLERAWNRETAQATMTCTFFVA